MVRRASSAWTDEDERVCSYLAGLSDAQWSRMHRCPIPETYVLAFAAVACRRGSISILRRLLAKGLVLSCVRVSPLKIPLLNIAVIFEQEAVIRLLLHHGSSPYDADSWGRKAFSLAASRQMPLFWNDTAA